MPRDVQFSLRKAVGRELQLRVGLSQSPARELLSVSDRPQGDGGHCRLSSGRLVT
jgi:hypothetical protein